MIDDKMVCQWLTAIADSLRDQILPAVDDEYAKEQAVGAYVLARTVQRYLSTVTTPSSREAELAEALTRGTAGALEALSQITQIREWDHEPASLSIAAHQSANAVALLWAHKKDMPEEMFAEAQSGLRRSWRQVLERDREFYPPSPKDRRNRVRET